MGEGVDKACVVLLLIKIKFNNHRSGACKTLSYPFVNVLWPDRLKLYFDQQCNTTLPILISLLYIPVFLVLGCSYFIAGVFLVEIIITVPVKLLWAYTEGKGYTTGVYQVSLQ